MAKKTETEKKPATTTKPESVVQSDSKSSSGVKLLIPLKNRWFLLGVGAIVLALVAWFTYSTFIKEEPVDDGGELSYAEQLETFGMSEEADQDATNTVLLTKAAAHYSEGNYDTALERLASIVDPDPDTKAAVDQLYGDIYESMGQPEKALEYRKSTLAQQEKELLENVDEAPDLHFALAQLYENAGDTTKAKEHYQLFVDEFDASPEDLAEDALIQALETSKQKLQSL